MQVISLLKKSFKTLTTLMFVQKYVYLFSKVNKFVNYKKTVSNSLSAIIMVPFLILCLLLIKINQSIRVLFLFTILQ